MSLSEDVEKTTKRCPKCGETKNIDCFNKCSSTKDGHKCHCRECQKAAYREYKQTHPDVGRKWRQDNAEKLTAYFHQYHKANAEKKAAYDRDYYAANKSKIAQQKKIYRQENADKICEWHKANYKENENYRLGMRLRIRMWFALKGITKGLSTIELLGCSIDELRQHLEGQFIDGMSWDNYGYYGWHIDHVRPCALFDLTDMKQQKQCFHYTNLQPLWANDNLSKGCRVV